MAKEGQKTLQVFIPVVMSDIVQSNGLTPYVDFLIERLYLANNLTTFTRYSGLKISGKFFAAVGSILGTIALAVKAYKDYLNIKKTQKELSSSYNFEESTMLLEDLNFILDKPTQIVINDTLIIFRAMNFISKKDIEHFKLKTDQVSSVFQRIVSKYFRSTVSIVTKDVFYCYSIEEVEDVDLKQKLSQPNTNIVIVDQVNDRISVYMKTKGVVVKNIVKLSKIVSDKKSMSGDEIPIDRIIRSLKSIQVSRGL